MKKILIVDDDEDDKDFLCEAIQHIDRSAYCIWVSDGVHALRLINDPGFIPPDFIFLDLSMPKVGGIQCLDNIRKLTQYRNIPVIIYTTLPNAIDQLDISSFGPTSVLSKPTRIGDLIKSVEEIFSGQHRMVSDR